MYDISIIYDLDQCRQIWSRLIPAEAVWDLWEFRSCFHKHYQRPVCFIVASDTDGPTEILPLSWIQESGCYGYFAGETWQGKTWIEQNRLPSDSVILSDMLDHCPGPYLLRYLLPPSEPSDDDQFAVDEIGYLFRPPDFDYDMDNYFRQFSGKSARNIKREVASLHARAAFRYDDLSDFEHMVQLNLSNFAETSFFSDTRFLESFRSLMHYFDEQGWLRMTTVIIDGDVAAVDMGCIYRGTYTLLAGGTNRDYPGVAKLINLHHMQRGCRERMNLLDFLCGNFSWKKKFHLTERPLYLLSTYSTEDHLSIESDLAEAANVK